MESLNRKKYNSEVILKFILVSFAVLFLIFMLIITCSIIKYYGFLDNATSALKNALLTWVPTAVLIISILVFIVSFYLYSKSKRLAKGWDGEDEDLIDEIEHNLFIVSSICSISVISFFLFIGLDSYIGREAAFHVVNSVIHIIAIIFTVVWTTALQGRVVSLEYELKQDCYANVLDFGFARKMFEGKDEGQKMIIYKAAYEVYNSLVWINAVAFLIAYYCNKFAGTGLLAVILICLSWLAETIIYLRASYKYKNKG